MQPPEMTSLPPLIAHLKARISREGPLSVADVMSEALLHPEHGYYTNREPFGAAGDFTTAPEISQMFGELIGLWAAVVWQQMGAPRTLRLIELGPGRGTLMSDALRAAKQLPGFLAATQIHLVEASPRLRALQQQTLNGHNVSWHERLEEVPDGPTLLICNEFFDALPIHQLVRKGQSWCERRVGLSEPGDELAWTDTAVPSTQAELVEPRLAGLAKEGDIVEVSPASLDVATTIAERLQAFGGAALVIDYGHLESGLGDTLQAVLRHEFADILSTLGEADLTAHVDFSALARTVVASGARVQGAATQGAFLRSLGIEARAAKLMAGATSNQRSQVESALKRLIADEEMGTLFKVMAWSDSRMADLPGFER